MKVAFCEFATGKGVYKITEHSRRSSTSKTDYNLTKIIIDNRRSLLEGSLLLWIPTGSCSSNFLDVLSMKRFEFRTKTMSSGTCHEWWWSQLRFGIDQTCHNRIWNMGLRKWRRAKVQSSQWIATIAKNR